MKRLLLVLTIIIASVTAFSQTIAFETTHFSYKEKNYYGWSNWSNWEPSRSLMTIDLNNDMIVIYTQQTQYYNIVSVGESYVSGNAQVQEFGFIDQDGDRGTFRLVLRTTGRSEIYIAFNNIMWGYIVVRR